MRAKRSWPRPLILAVAGGVPLLVALFLALPKGPALRTGPWRSFERREELGSASRLAMQRPLGAPTQTSEWRISATTRSSLGEHVWYTQTIDGLPVLGSFGVEHRLEDGGFHVEGRETPLRARWSARIDSSRVIEAARAHARVEALRGAPSVLLGFWPLDDHLEPTASVLLPSARPFGDWRVVVGLSSGALLDLEDVISGATGSGRVFQQTPDLACGTEPGVSDEQLAPFIDTVSLDELDGSGYLDGAYARVLDGAGERVHSPSLSFLYAPSQIGFEQVVCYHTITRYFAHVEALGVQGFGQRAVVVDARGYAGDNSFFSPATGRITMGTGGVPDGQDPEVVLHELGHSLHFRAQPEYYATVESRTVSEGIADFLSCSYFDDPLLGEWDAMAYSTECPPYVRRLDGAPHYPEDLTGKLHADGLILASALWEARSLLGPRLADRVVLEGLFFLRPDSDLRHAAEVFLATLALVDPAVDRERARAVFRDRGLVDAVPGPIDAHALQVQAYPNPSRGPVTLQLTLPSPSHVVVDIMDVRGRRVRRLLDGDQPFGTRAVAWDGADDGGAPVSSGIYFYAIRTSTRAASGKLIVLPR